MSHLYQDLFIRNHYGKRRDPEWKVCIMHTLTNLTELCIWHTILVLSSIHSYIIPYSIWRLVLRCLTIW